LGLTREVVVRAAVRIAQVEGIETISMRRVAQDLGVTPMALYRYLPDKEALIDVVVDEALSAVPVPDRSETMPDELLNCFTRLYDLLLEQPGLARTAGGRPLEGPIATRLAEGVLALLQGNGICEDEAAKLLVSAFSLILGFALYRTSRSDRGESSPLAASRDEAPTVRRVWGRLAAAGADDAVFRDALARLVAGYLNASAMPTVGLS
jgi:AcrR family transcriptional regulator